MALSNDFFAVEELDSGRSQLVQWFVLPIAVASILVPRVSQATRKSDSLNSYFLAQPSGT